MKINPYNLRGQNLLRHQMIQNYLGKDLLLISDSINFIDLLLISIFHNKNKILHILEVYSISYDACISEYLHRWRSIGFNILLYIKSFCGFIFAILKVFLMKNIALNNRFIIVSSNMRKQYLMDSGSVFNIKVLRNKPLYDYINDGRNPLRKDIILLIGNMYSCKDDFLKVQKFACENGLEIHCYGLCFDDVNWIGDLKFSNVFLFKKVNHEEIIKLIKISKYALCLYSNSTVNNRFSASSKIFELLYYGALPIISNNPGLIYELTDIGADYIIINDLNKYTNNIEINTSLYNNRKCLFNDELFNI